MKKRKNIIISAVTCMVSICLMMFGVYAATNPSVSINGQVSYTVTDAKLLVQGKLTGAKDVENGTYPEAAATYTSSTRVVDKNNQYLDFTTGGSTGNASDKLESWKLGDLNFEETAGGINPIVAGLKITNYSPYNVKATITMASDLENVSRVIKKGSKVMTETSTRTYQLILPAFETTAKSTEISVEYSVVDDSKKVEKQNINFEVKFEWTNEQPTPTISVDDIIASNGIVTMGRTHVWTEQQYNYEWKVDEDGFVLNFDGTKMQTDDGDNIKVIGYDNDRYYWTFVTTSDVSLRLGYDNNVNLPTLVLASDSNTAVITGGLDMRIYMPTKDVKWIAFAYKDANGELKKIQYNYDSDWRAAPSPETAENMREATSVYFTVYYDVPVSFYRQVYLETDKITKTIVDNDYGAFVTKCAHNGTNAPSSVMAGDYYYSDIRQRIRNADCDLIRSLNIDSNNSIFKNIQTRTINDLYKNNIHDESNDYSAGYSDQPLPTGADGTQEDMFWVLSAKEISIGEYQEVFSYPGEYESGRNSSWTRTLDPSRGCVIDYNNYHGGSLGTQCLPDYMENYYQTGKLDNGFGPRIGFELTLG